METTPPGTDRDDLLATLAERLEYVPADVLERTRREGGGDSLGDALERAGALSASRRALLESLVTERLGPGAPAPDPDFASETRAVDPAATPDHPAKTAGAWSTRMTIDPDATRVLSNSGGRGHFGPGLAGDGASNRFRKVRIHAAGGLGVVLIAHDDELDRLVAFKQIQDRHADDPESRSRFLVEARITGGLEHPGIVPVYSLGQESDGRPYYAMRFIEGDSLKDAIDRFHEPEGPGHDPVRRPLELQKLLRRFLDVCEAVAYAHDRGVMHRDLKPANIMLGRYGETIVVDWGLAKVYGEPEAPAEGLPPSGLASLSNQGSTLPGSAIGTPAFMSPEQAGAGDSPIGPAADVYSLGATLYVLLTGRAAVEGPDLKTILDRVRNGDVRPPREVAPEVPPALDAICRKAMAKRPEDRYESALALASDVESWLADEPVSAWREPPSARLRRWARRRSRLVAGLAAGILTALVASAALATVVSVANGRLSKANTRIGQQVAQIEAQNQRLSETNSALKVAEAAAERGRLRAEAVTNFLVESFRSPDPGRSGRSITIAEVLDHAAESLEARDDVPPTLRASMLNAVGQTYDSLGLVAETLAAFTAARDLRLEALGAGDPETLVSENNIAQALLAAGRPAEAIPILERASEALRERLGPLASETLAARNNLALAYQGTGRTVEALEILEAVAEERGSTFGPDHAATLLSENNLAVADQAAGRIDDAIRIFRRILEVRERELGPEHPDTLLSRNNLASATKSAGRISEAIALYERTLEDSRAALGDDHPATLNTQGNLAAALDRSGRVAEAIPLYERTLDALRTKVDPVHPLILNAENNLGLAYRSVGRNDEALELLEHVLKVRRETLPPGHPDTLLSQNNLAAAYETAGRPDDALALQEETLRAREETLPPGHPDVLFSRNNLAAAYDRAGRHAEALALHESTFRARVESLGPEHPDTIASENNLAMAYESADRPDDAFPLYEHAARIARERPDDVGPDGSTYQANLVRASLRAGRLEEAEAADRAALEAFRGRSGPEAAREVARTSNRLAATLLTSFREDEAAEVLREAVALEDRLPPDDPEIASARVLLAEALAGLGDFEEAEPLLLEGLHALAKPTGEGPPSEAVEAAFLEALEAAARIHDLWGKPTEAEEWRARAREYHSPPETPSPSTE